MSDYPKSTDSHRKPMTDVELLRIIATIIAEPAPPGWEKSTQVSREITPRMKRVTITLLAEPSPDAPPVHIERKPCGARGRSGNPCKMRVVEGKHRCRLHGGLSTGPRTAGGRDAIAQSNRKRAQRKREAEALSHTP